MTAGQPHGTVEVTEDSPTDTEIPARKHPEGKRTAGLVRRRWRFWRRALALVVLLGAASVVWVHVATSRPAVPLTVAFIGDSYTGGSDMGGNGDQNYTMILGHQLGWNIVNHAAGGTGYVHGSAEAGPFESQQLPAVVAAHPDVVIIVGSRNDINERPQDITQAADHLYDSIRRQLPGAKILVESPIWPGGAPPAMDDVRTAVLRAAATDDVPFVDPITDRWFDDGQVGLIGSDGVHPNDAGHAYIAERMIGVLQRTITVHR